MKLYQVDAFTSQQFSGNQAGVMIVDEFPTEEYMQNIASEMNLSETAFVKKRSENTYEIIFYTPSEEIDLCGHATLSSAHILYTQKLVDIQSEIRFFAKGGELKIQKKDDVYLMDFPKWTYEETGDVDGATQITGIAGIREVFQASNGWGIVTLDTIEELKRITPNFGSMKGTDYGNVVVTCGGDDEYDYYIRCFVTDCGINEDPVTGSIECVLAPFWGERLGKTKMKSYQCSGRGGEKGVELLGDRVIISGEAVTVFEIEVLSN